MTRQIVVTGVKCEKCDGTGFEPCWEPVPCGGEPCSRCYQTGTTVLALDLGSLPPAAIEAAAKAWCEANGHTFAECPWEEQHIINAGLAVRAALTVLVDGNDSEQVSSDTH